MNLPKPVAKFGALLAWVEVSKARIRGEVVSQVYCGHQTAQSILSVGGKPPEGRQGVDWFSYGVDR